MNHPLEEEIMLPDGEVVKVHGAWAVDWRRVQGTSKEAEWLEALAKLVDEWQSKS